MTGWPQSGPPEGLMRVALGRLASFAGQIRYDERAYQVTVECGDPTSDVWIRPA